MARETALAIEPADDIEPPFGRPLAHWVRELDKHPSSIMKDILDGKVLSDGTELRMAATKTGGRWHIRRKDIEEYYQAITADRLRSRRRSRLRLATPSSPSASHEAAERLLERNGF